jgi:hypothetical protein
VSGDGYPLRKDIYSSLAGFFCVEQEMLISIPWRVFITLECNHKARTQEARAHIL